jgi:hypothetical protein
METEEENIFQKLETTESPSNDIKNAVFSELELLQNSSKLIEHFAGNYFKSLIEIFNK